MTGAAGLSAPANTAAAPLVSATGRSGISGQGPFYDVTLAARDGRVVEASYRTFGCVWAETIGSMAMAMTTGRTLLDCGAITEQALRERLIEGIPRSKEELPGMVCEAVRQAAEDLRRASGDVPSQLT